MPPAPCWGHHVKVEKRMRKMNILGKIALSGILCIMAFALASQGALAMDNKAKVIFVVT